MGHMHHLQEGPGCNARLGGTALLLQTGSTLGILACTPAGSCALSLSYPLAGAFLDVLVCCCSCPKPSCTSWSSQLLSLVLLL